MLHSISIQINLKFKMAARDRKFHIHFNLGVLHPSITSYHNNSDIQLISTKSNDYL